MPPTMHLEASTIQYFARIPNGTISTATLVLSESRTGFFPHLPEIGLAGITEEYVAEWLDREG